MLLECIKPFGFHQPGDTVEVPDGDVYDTEYYKQAEEPKKADKK